MTDMPELSPHQRAQLLTAWAEALGVAPSAFEGDSVRHVERDDLDSVVVVALGGATVVAAPSHAQAELRGLPPDRLRDADAIAALLDAEPIGSAHLLCTGVRPPHPRHAVLAAEGRDVEELRALVSADDWSEAGVEPMERRWAVRDADEPVAIAGYQRWRTTIAHVGVIAAAAQRGRGFATSAAAHAVSAAFDEGLVPQWRCRVGNAASLRLADRLGFTRLGSQSAVALVPR